MNECVLVCAMRRKDRVMSWLSDSTVEFASSGVRGRHRFERVGTDRI